MHKKSILIALTLALFSCAKPEITVEPASSPVGSQPVGVLEIGKAHTGSKLGIPIGESLAESAYCAATVLESGLIATSADCLQDEKNSYDVAEMRFHLRAANGEKTKHYSVKAVQSVDGARNLALLSLQQIPEVIVRTSIPSRWDGPPAKAGTEPAPALSATALSVPDPDKRGVVRIEATAVRLETESLPALKPVSDKAETEDAEDEEKPVAVSESPFAHPRAISVVGLKSGNRGSPIFIDGQLVGILRGNPAIRKNGHWLVGPAK